MPFIDELRDLGECGALCLAGPRDVASQPASRSTRRSESPMTFVDNKIARCRAFLNHADALKAVGLEE